MVQAVAALGVGYLVYTGNLAGLSQTETTPSPTLRAEYLNDYIELSIMAGARA